MRENNQKNQKAVSCGVCLGSNHAKCAGVKYVLVNMDWTCSGCLLSALPFHKCRTDALIEDQEAIASYEFTENTENIVRVLKEQSKNLRLMHLNTQCMTSTFNEFLLTVKQFPMNVITLSETWLKNNPALLEYVSVPGYSAVFRNRESIKGGGVGAYMHESIQFKRRCDIENLHPDLEHLWLELPGRNKHSKALIGIMYRSKLKLSESDWLEGVESLLGYLTMSWDGLLVVTGDVNIDMRKPSDNLTRKYQTLLEVFSLKQIVTKPTRVTRTSKTLINHIVVNFPQNITYTDVIPCSMVGDHDAPFACINVRVPRFEPRFKFLRNEKELDENAFKEDFSLLHLDVVYGLESPDHMVDALNSLMKSNLALNKHKTEWMLLSTKKMLRVHSLQTASDDISCNGESLERVTRTKLLGVHMHERLTWSNHINELVTSCYRALVVLKKLRNLAPFRVKKQ